MNMKEYVRKKFAEEVTRRDKGKCVICGDSGVDVHHIIDRHLFSDGGYNIDNGVLLCSTCHLSAESGEFDCQDLRNCAGITNIVIPDLIPYIGNMDRFGAQRSGILRKYPKIWHLPWSRSFDTHDRVFSMKRKTRCCIICQ